MLSVPESVIVVASGIDHPECVNVGPDGAVYAGGRGGQIYRVAPDGSTSVLGIVEGAVGGLCLDGAANVYACNSHRIDRIAPSGQMSVYSGPGLNLVLPNYPVFDDGGYLYYSESDSLYSNRGSLLVVSPNGRTLKVADGLRFPNGLAIDPTGKHLYVIESTASLVVRFGLGPGRLGPKEIVAELPGAFPDGLAFAASGNLYIACYIPDLVCKVDPSGHVTEVARDLYGDVLNRPTNAAFAPNSTLLLISNFGGTTIVGLDVGERGAPLRFPSVRWAGAPAHMA